MVTTYCAFIQMFLTAARIFPTSCLCFHLCDDESQSHSGGLTGFLLAALKAAGYLDHIITAWLLIQILATKRDEKILQIEKQSLEEVPCSWRAGKPLPMRAPYLISTIFDCEMSRDLFKYDWTVMGRDNANGQCNETIWFLIPTHLCHRQLT